MLLHRAIRKYGKQSFEFATKEAAINAYRSALVERLQALLILHPEHVDEIPESIRSRIVSEPNSIESPEQISRSDAATPAVAIRETARHANTHPVDLEVC